MSEEDTELYILKQRELTLKLRKLEMVKQNRLAFYEPHPKQQQFHSAAEFKQRMFRAGNRSGKSHMGCAEDCAWLLGERTWYDAASPLRKLGIPDHPVKLLVITTDWDKVDEIFTSQKGEGGKLWQFLPKGCVKSHKRNHSGVIDQLELNNGSTIRFDTVRSWMSNPQGSESSDWDAIHVDEPCPEEMFKASARGLIDRDGSSWFTLTPLSEPWIQDLFFPKGRNQTEHIQINNGRKQTWSITGSTFDNPHNPKQSIEAYGESLTDDEKQCRLMGIPLFLSGLVYKEFDPSRHVLTQVPRGWKSYNEPPDDYTIYFAIDPHPQTPHAVLFCAVSPQGYKFFYDEIFHHCTIEDLSHRINNKTAGRFVGGGRCDPLAYIHDPISDGCMADAFFQHGVFFEKATKDLSGGILKAKEELLKANNLYVCPTMTRFLWEVNRYSWDKDNKPVDKDDHMMECFYRLNLEDLRFLGDFTKDNTSINDIEIPISTLYGNDF